MPFVKWTWKMLSSAENNFCGIPLLHKQTTYIWGTCGCVMSQWNGLFFKGTFVFSCTYILTRHLWNIISTDNSIQISFIFHSEKTDANKKRLEFRLDFDLLWASGRYTALYHSVTVYSIIYTVNVVYSTTRPMAIPLLEF